MHVGIAMVEDRVVQSSTRMVVEPIIQRIFAPQRYGFLPG